MSYLAFAREMLGNLFKPPATVEYPLKPKTFPEINRGKVVNSIDDCIFCGMCMRVCPSAAITVDRGARTWSINRFACVQCKGCVDHCPKKCLRAVYGTGQGKNQRSFAGQAPAAACARERDSGARSRCRRCCFRQDCRFRSAGKQRFRCGCCCAKGKDERPGRSFPCMNILLPSAL